MITVTVVAIGLLAACSDGESTQGAAESQYNPASDRMGALAGIPADSDVPSGGVIPNLAPVVEAGRLAAANTEAGMVKTGARAYLVDHPFAAKISSDELQPPYISGQLKANYRLVLATQWVLGVESVPGGWAGIVFSLSQQKWVQGIPDNDHGNDQDVP